MMSKMMRSISESFSSSSSSAAGPLPTVVTRYPSSSKLNLIPIARWRSSSTIRMCLAEAIGSRLIGFSKRILSTRHVFTHQDTKQIQQAERGGHEHHADRVGGREDHRDHANHEDRDPPLLHVKVESRDADAIEKQHHQWKLKADAKAERQNQHEAQPFADPRIEI